MATTDVHSPRRRRRLPRGVNFILGGLLVAAGAIVYSVLAGPIDLGGFGAPDVLIGDPADVLGVSRGGAAAAQP